MISVIIPTYREPEYLDVCLKSCILGQKDKNEIIVVTDGYFNENIEVLKKWKDYIKVVDLGENMGLPRATNFGVYNATEEYVLIVNDDNVFPKFWDDKLDKLDKTHNVVY